MTPNIMPPMPIADVATYSKLLSVLNTPNNKPDARYTLALPYRDLKYGKYWSTREEWRELDETSRDIIMKESTLN